MRREVPEGYAVSLSDWKSTSPSLEACRNDTWLENLTRVGGCNLEVSDSVYLLGLKEGIKTISGRGEGAWKKSARCREFRDLKRLCSLSMQIVSASCC